VATLARLRSSLGISGHFNTSGSDGTITRFGWKAQNKSLMIFAGEAYNVEMGVTNELFPNERNTTSGCAINPTPEDATNFTNTSICILDIGSGRLGRHRQRPVGGVGICGAFDVKFFDVSYAGRVGDSRAAGVHEHRLPGLPHSESNHGAVRYRFNSKQCGVLAVQRFCRAQHGTGLADNITQGNATGTQFRSAPLWGVGQRIFFLHDGRTNDLKVAIQQHASSGSEANQVIQNFNLLSTNDQQSLLNFLRSL
jgi:hypothetical protein